VETTVRRLIPLALALALPTAAGADEPRKPDWRGGAEFDLTLRPGWDFFPYGRAYVERNSLHFEGRYNYEAASTGSLFAGWNFEGELKGLSFSITPLLGGAIGHTRGVIFGGLADATFWRLAFHTETELLLAFSSSEDASFIYTYSQLGYVITDWLQAGATMQRTRIVKSPLEIDPGLFVAVQRGGFSVSLYGFNFLRSDRYALLTLAYDLK
jgi:hypothetical protein